MSQTAQSMKELWEESFSEQIAGGAYNTAAVEALVRNVSYYLRGRFAGEKLRQLHFLELGCGAGPNLLWLAQKGIRVSGVDISPTAIGLARKTLERAGAGDRVGQLVEASVSQVPLPDGLFDGILESCVFQHLAKEDRARAFAEVRRLLKPGGLFVGYMLDRGHTVYQAKMREEDTHDPGTLMLNDGSCKFHLTNIGVSHFFGREEYSKLLEGFSVVDPCLTTYYLPKDEAKKRGYAEYLQSMWAVYAIK